MNDKILFIDRDGTLIHEPNDNFQIDCLEKLLFEPYVIPTLLTLKKMGFTFIIITNQNGLGSTLFPKEKFYKPHNFMIQIFQSQGIIFHQVLICPHWPEEQCNCRKPNTGLVDPWLHHNQLDKFNSYVIGDRDTDLLLAEKMNIQGIQYHHVNYNWKKIKNQIIQNYRSAYVHTTTTETNVKVEIWLDQKNISHINTGINFFNHMLQQISTHAKLCMNITAKGDVCIDDHHTIEDTALALGTSIKKALQNKRGIQRFGFVLPMDESVAQCILDISGRSYFQYDVKYSYQKIGDLSTEMIEHFFRSLSSNMKCALHLKATGKNDHHIAESLFKSFGKTLYQAIHINKNNSDIIPSSKGKLL